jgi:hypothetical protein
VAECALRGVKPVSRLNVGRTVLTGLRFGAGASRQPHPDEKRCDSGYLVRSAHGRLSPRFYLTMEMAE